MNILSKIYRFYRDGFKEMTIGKSLWIIILIKLFIMFAILRVFFFPNQLSKFKTKEDKAKHVIENLTTINPDKDDSNNN